MNDDELVGLSCPTFLSNNDEVLLMTTIVPYYDISEEQSHAILFPAVMQARTPLMNML